MKDLEKQIQELAERIRRHPEPLTAVRRAFVGAGVCPSEHDRDEIAIIQSTVCAHYKVPMECMTLHVRTETYLRARTLAMYLCRILIRCSLSDIDVAFQRTNGCVINAFRSIRNRMETEREFAKEVLVVKKAASEKLDAWMLERLGKRKTAA